MTKLLPSPPGPDTELVFTHISAFIYIILGLSMLKPLSSEVRFSRNLFPLKHQSVEILGQCDF